MQYRLKQLSYSICSLFAPILLVEERFDQRLTEYSAFWASLLALCENYCAEADAGSLPVRKQVLVRAKTPFMDVQEESRRFLRDILFTFTNQRP